MKISNKLARFSLVLNGLLIVLFSITFIFAVIQRMEAESIKMEAEMCQSELNAERAMAIEAERIARERMNEAIKQAELANQKAKEARLNKD